MIEQQRQSFQQLARWFLVTTCVVALTGPILHALLPGIYRGEIFEPLHRLVRAHESGLPAPGSLTYYHLLLHDSWLKLIAVLGGAGILLLVAGGWNPVRELRSFLFADTDPRNLAVLRVVVFASLLLMWDPALNWRLAAAPPELIVPPPGLGWLGDRLVPGRPSILWLSALFVPTTIAAAAGFRTRTTAPIATGLAIVLLGIPQFFGKVNHYHHLIWVALLLSVSRSSDAWSLDRRLSREKAATLPAPSTRYGVPIRLTWLLLSVCYFFPGLWKLVTTPGWIDGSALVAHLHSKWESLDGWVPAFRIDRSPLLLQLSSVATVALELAFPFLLFRKSTRRLAIASGLVFHLLIGLLMRIWFWPLAVLYVAFIDWGKLAANRRTAEQPPTDEKSQRPRPGVVLPLSVGAGLLVANIVCGVWQIDTWPLAVYPTFKGNPGLQVSRFEAEVTGADGTTREIPTNELRGSFPSERWEGLVRTVARTPSGEKLSALVSFIEYENPTLFDEATSIRFVRVLRPFGRPDHAERQLVGVVQADGGVVAAVPQDG